MGLDHNSGLQGAFRNSVHDLESLAARFETSKIYLNLLQIRRAEKDLGLRKDSQYQQQVLLLIANFKATTQQSNLGEDFKRQLISPYWLLLRCLFRILIESAIQPGH